MTRGSVSLRRAALGSLLLLAGSGSLEAQGGHFIDPELTLSARIVFRQPVVSSFARGVLYDGRGRRVYEPVILGHDVIDESSVLRFHASVVFDNGYANSRTGDMEGEFDRCYEARLGAHANAYNLHILLFAPAQCIPPVETPEPDVPDENCPILLDLERDGFHLSGPDLPVDFDIDADGSLDSIAWTRSGDDDAFLCLDRNGNGVIDNGAELFGYATRLLSGNRAKVGYRALAELDERQLGGNRDGKVDAADPLFHSLCAWVDTNRDGISQPIEIHGLAEVGVVSLEYAYRTTRIVDSFGNWFRYVSSSRMRTPSGAVHTWPTFDVIFAEP
ncbi:MAG TPA: hypothetical protein VKK31_09050 [Thermoanaerobaculia bacterium]|nr:hypothetical protein [Thermoanaerobaculia bacterium]